jgi:hypothetical protein
MKYILIAFAFVACTNTSKKSELKISTEVLDTVKTVPATITAAPLLLEKAFINGSTEKIKNTDVTLYGITIGKLKITSGHIVACDPLHVDEYGLPYTQLFPTGEFPVQLSIAKAGEGEMTAFARILFSEAPVVRWELALLKDQKPLAVGGEDIHGYGVDWGRAIFMDEAAIKSIDLVAIADSDHPLYKEMDKHYHNDWKYAMFNAGNYNIAAFTTGSGDGTFATYIGFDAAGKPCRLVSDFGLFEWRKK